MLYIANYVPATPRLMFAEGPAPICPSDAPGFGALPTAGVELRPGVELGVAGTWVDLTARIWKVPAKW